MSTKFDCQRCGACCYNPPSNVVIDDQDYVEVNPRSKLLKENETASKYTFVKNGKHWMRMVGSVPRCCALTGRKGKDVSCSIYEMRPTVCRLVRPGDEECRQRRKEHWIE